MGNRSTTFDRRTCKLTSRQFNETHQAGKNRRSTAGQAAVWQARLIMLVMINVAQLWILAATVEAALARHYSVLIPLVVASGVCFLITLSIIRWWRPTSVRRLVPGTYAERMIIRRLRRFTFERSASAFFSQEICVICVICG